MASRLLVWENSRHLATLPLVSPPNDVWETGAEIPYWWRVISQIWVVLLIGWIKFPKRHDQLEALPRSGQWHVISMEFLRSFLRRHLVGKPVLSSPNVGCVLRLRASVLSLSAPKLSSKTPLFQVKSHQNPNTHCTQTRRVLFFCRLCRAATLVPEAKQITRLFLQR